MDILRRLFGLHVHSFGKWEPVKVLSNTCGDFIVIQRRQCVAFNKDSTVKVCN